MLTEQQLQTLRTVYTSNPRPDALMKEHLCEITGLSPKVIRVWFQNKRCKDKKKQKHDESMQQQHQRLAGGGNVSVGDGRGGITHQLQAKSSLACHPFTCQEWSKAKDEGLASETKARDNESGKRMRCLGGDVTEGSWGLETWGACLSSLSLSLS